MVPLTVSYLGDLRCQAVHGPSGATLLTDAPVDNHGKGEAFSPTDLAATATATCMLTILGIVARRDGTDLGGARVEVEKHMTTPPAARRIARLVLRLRLPAAVPTERREAWKRAAETCPVRLSLGPEVAVEEVWDWDL